MNYRSGLAFLAPTDLLKALTSNPEENAACSKSIVRLQRVIQFIPEFEKQVHSRAERRARIVL